MRAVAEPTPNNITQRIAPANVFAVKKTVNLGSTTLPLDLEGCLRIIMAVADEELDSVHVSLLAVCGKSLCDLTEIARHPGAVHSLFQLFKTHGKTQCNQVLKMFMFRN